jgi:lipopolysaccharide/colanic/teichoic acid biosynthesis glycosyltransferase
VFFRQERRGFNGQSFMIWKFRSMHVLESGHSMSQAGRDDARFTRIGRFIRKTSIDELPQLINVLLNDMSLVGPRPHALSHDDALVEKLTDYAYRNRIKPGITGWAQVNGHRGETRTPEQIHARVLCDLYYIENWTVFLDCWILLLTLFSPRVHRGAF